MRLLNQISVIVTSCRFVSTRYTAFVQGKIKSRTASILSLLHTRFHLLFYTWLVKSAEARIRLLSIIEAQDATPSNYCLTISFLGL